MVQTILTHFSLDGTPKDGLSAIINIRELPSGSLVVSGAAMTGIGDGGYIYDFTAYDYEKEYSGVCDGGNTLREFERYTYLGNENYVDDIDSVIDNNTTILGVSADVLNVDTNVLSLSASVHTKLDTVISNQASGASPDAIAGAVWGYDLSTAPSGSAGNILLTTSQQVSANQEYLKRIVGLTHENIYIDNPIYDGDGNLTNARVRIYSDAASVGTGNNVIGAYNITAPSDAPGQFTTWKQVKI